MAPMAPQMRRVPLNQVSSLAADQYALAVRELSPAARGLLGDDGQVRERVHELAEFALTPWEAESGSGGDDAWLDSRVPEVLLDPQIGRLIDVIAGQLPYVTSTDRPVLEAAIRDLLLVPSLVPSRLVMIGGRAVRLTMDTLSPAQLGRLLDAIARLLVNGRSPVRGWNGPEPQEFLARYKPGQPLGERLAALLVHILSPVRPADRQFAPQDLLLQHDMLFNRLSSDSQLLAAAMFATSSPMATDPSAPGAASTNRQLGERLPTIAGLLFAADWVLNSPSLQGLPAAQLIGADIHEIRMAAYGLFGSPFARRPSPAEAVRKLVDLTARWNGQMRALYHMLETDPGNPDRGTADQYRHEFDSLLAVALSDRRDSLGALGGDAQAELWEEMRWHGGAVARSSPDTERYVYIRAERLADGRRMFSVADPQEGGERSIGLGDLPGEWQVERPGEPYRLRYADPPEWSRSALLPAYDPVPANGGERELSFRGLEPGPEHVLMATGLPFTQVDNQSRTSETHGEPAQFFLFVDWAVSHLPDLLASLRLRRVLIEPSPVSFFRALARAVRGGSPIRRQQIRYVLQRAVSSRALSEHLAAVLASQARQAGRGSADRELLEELAGMLRDGRWPADPAHARLIVQAAANAFGPIKLLAPGEREQRIGFRGAAGERSQSLYLIWAGRHFDATEPLRDDEMAAPRPTDAPSDPEHGRELDRRAADIGDDFAEVWGLAQAGLGGAGDRAQSLLLQFEAIYERLLFVMRTPKTPRRNALLEEYLVGAWRLYDEAMQQPWWNRQSPPLTVPPFRLPSAASAGAAQGADIGELVRARRLRAAGVTIPGQDAAGQAALERARDAYIRAFRQLRASLTSIPAGDRPASYDRVYRVFAAFDTRVRRQQEDPALLTWAWVDRRLGARYARLAELAAGMPASSGSAVRRPEGTDAPGRPVAWPEPTQWAAARRGAGDDVAAFEGLLGSYMFADWAVSALPSLLTSLGLRRVPVDPSPASFFAALSRVVPGSPSPQQLRARLADALERQDATSEEQSGLLRMLAGVLRGGNWPSEYAETIARAAALEFGPVTLLTYRADGHLMRFPGREGSDDPVFLVWAGVHFEAAVRLGDGEPADAGGAGEEAAIMPASGGTQDQDFDALRWDFEVLRQRLASEIPGLPPDRSHSLQLQLDAVSEQVQDLADAPAATANGNAQLSEYIAGLRRLGDEARQRPWWQGFSMP
jgi:hypothetical protein